MGYGGTQPSTNARNPELPPSQLENVPKSVGDETLQVPPASKKAQVQEKETTAYQMW